MTKYLSYLLVAGVMLFDACCVIDSVSGDDQGMVSQSGVVTLGIEGKKFYTKLEVSMPSGLVSWSEGDRVAYCVTDGGASRWLVFPVDASASEMSVNVPTGNRRDGFAVYPASAVCTAYGEVSFTGPVVCYPDFYVISEVNDQTFTPCPLVALNDSGNLDFYHAGGLLRLFLDGLPSGLSSVDVSFIGQDMKPVIVTGHFLVSCAGTPAAFCIPLGDVSDPSHPTMAGNSVVFTGGADGFGGSVYLNIPVPAVVFPAVCVVSVSLKDSAGNVLGTMEKDMKVKGSVRARGFTSTYSFVL